MGQRSSAAQATGPLQVLSLALPLCDNGWSRGKYGSFGTILRNDSISQ